MLIIDLRHLKQAPIEAEGEIAGHDPVWRGFGAELARPVAVEVRAEATAAGSIWVRGSLSGRVHSACRRCLQPLELDVADEFDLLFDPKSTQDDEDLTLYALDRSAEELDLRGAIAERFMLAVSDFPLCREDCRGLCARCGSNLNDGDCGCEAGEPDPRWAPLSALKGDA